MAIIICDMCEKEFEDDYVNTLGRCPQCIAYMEDTDDCDSSDNNCCKDGCCNCALDGGCGGECDCN